MPQMTTMKLADIKIEEQVRKVFPQLELDELTASIKELGVLQPPLVRKDGRLLAGEMRCRASMQAGLTEIPVIVTDKLLSDSDVRIIQLTENLHRAELRDSEKWRAYEELLRLNPVWTHKDLAAHLKLGESAISKYLAPSRCSREVQEALEAGRIGITAVYEISKAPADQHRELLRLKLSGTSRDGLAERVRRQKSESVPKVRVKRVVCRLSSGVSITVTGIELSLDDLIESLAEAHKEARKAREQGLDAKTFQAVMRDKSKAGS